MERVLTRYAASTDLRANAPFVVERGCEKTLGFPRLGFQPKKGKNF